VGLAFLLFLAGLEIDAGRLRGRLLRLAGVGFLFTVEPTAPLPRTRP
jgi:Kef-type K+ transport system membrane component KefB